MGMELLPAAFLFEYCFDCRYVAEIPLSSGDRLLDLPSACRVDGLVRMTGRQPFAEVALAWNERGLGFQVAVRGKDRAAVADARHPRSSDGALLWIDTRDARTSHRASRYCHCFYFLPTGGGSHRDEPACGQLKISRALADAPLCRPEHIAFAVTPQTGGYILEAFLPAEVLHGFDPETNRRLGFFYVVKDAELGEQTLSVGPEFPYWDDPSLWSVLNLRS